MPLYIDPCGTLNQQAHCNAANGQPTSPVIQNTEATPEGSVNGLAVGLHLVWDTVGEVLYVFNGTVGQNTGWVAINP